MKPLYENKFFIAILVASALLNVGLAHKLQSDRRTLLSLQAGAPDRRVIGVEVNHLDAFDLAGKPVVISFTKDAPPTIIYVFRPACGWCAKNMANLQALEAAATQHYKLIGISLDTDNLNSYIENNHLSFPIYSGLRSDERLRLAMGGTPQTLMIANGAVVRNWGGAYTPDLQREIEAELGVKLPGLNASTVAHKS